jgi:hypothetical protein
MERSFSEIPAGFVLIPVVSARQHGAPFIPDNLLRIQKADAQESVPHFAGEYRSVPYISDPEAWHQFECFRPIGARVTRDGGFSVALRALLQVTGLSRTTAI